MYLEVDVRMTYVSRSTRKESYRLNRKDHSYQNGLIREYSGKLSSLERHPKIEEQSLVGRKGAKWSCNISR